MRHTAYFVCHLQHVRRMVKQQRQTVQDWITQTVKCETSPSQRVAAHRCHRNVTWPLSMTTIRSSSVENQLGRDTTPAPRTEEGNLCSRPMKHFSYPQCETSIQTLRSNWLYVPCHRRHTSPVSTVHTVRCATFPEQDIATSNELLQNRTEGDVLSSSAPSAPP